MQNPAIQQQITFLYTRDLMRTAHFYETIIGLKLWLDQGTCRIYQVSESGLLGFCQREDATTEHRDIIYTIVTDDVEDWYNTLRARGVQFEKAPGVNPKYNIYHCFLRDPNGYLLEIQRFLNPPLEEGHND